MSRQFRDPSIPALVKAIREQHARELAVQTDKDRRLAHFVTQYLTDIETGADNIVRGGTLH